MGKMMAECNVEGKNTRYALSKTGVWGEVVRQRKTILINDYAMPNPHIKGLPPGHVPLKRFLSIPVFSGEHIAAVVGVANKETLYDEFDERQLHLLMKQAWSVVEEQEKSNNEHEHREMLIHSEKLAAVGTMTASIAHDIRTPLAVIVSVADELRNGLAAKDNVEKILDIYLPPFERAVESLIGLSQSLTTFCRQGRSDSTDAKPHDVHVLLSENEALLKTFVKKYDVNILTRFCSAKPFVLLNGNDIRQVFLNLVKNACDAMINWDGPREIQISTDVLGAHVMVRFQDTGPGVPSDVANKIFDKFFTTKPAGSGTGLGLSICQDIVKRAGGTLSLKPSSQGALFELVFPLREPSEGR
jgi:signal transduction histidine kinase